MWCCVSFSVLASKWDTCRRKIYHSNCLGKDHCDKAIFNTCSMERLHNTSTQNIIWNTAASSLICSMYSVFYFKTIQMAHSTLLHPRTYSCSCWILLSKTSLSYSWANQLYLTADEHTDTRTLDCLKVIPEVFMEDCGLPCLILTSYHIFCLTACLMTPNLKKVIGWFVCNRHIALMQITLTSRMDIVFYF